MSETRYLERLRALVRRYKPGEGSVAFRGEYRAAILEALQQRIIPNEDADLLTEARVTLETWVGENPPTTGEALKQWLAFYEAGKARLPISLFEAFLGRLPRDSAQVDWPALVLNSVDRVLIDTLVQSRVLKPADISRVAEAHTAEFYRSAALDVLLDRGYSAPRAVWNRLAAGEARPSGLLVGSEALANSFATDKGADASSWLIGFLDRNPTLREDVLRQLLRDSEAVLRAAKSLTGYGADTKRRTAVTTGVAGFVTDLLKVCERAIDGQKRTSTTAGLVLGHLQLSAIAWPVMFAPEIRQAIAKSSARVTQAAITRALLGSEEERDGSSQLDDLFVIRASQLHEIVQDHLRTLCFSVSAVVRALQTAEDAESAIEGGAFVVTVQTLYAAVQEYLRRLPHGAEGEMESPERALRYERHRGRREVIQGLVIALDESRDSDGLMDAVEVVLYNVGVRHLGEIGQVAAFDPHAHQPETPGILPGEAVSISRAGWLLGNEDDGLVLSKARVRSHELAPELPAT